MTNEGESLKKTFLNGNTYVSIGFLCVLASLIIFGADLRSSNEINKMAIAKLNEKIDQEISLLRSENRATQQRMSEQFMEIKKEQQFLRERMIASINELRSLVYRIDGRLDILLPSKKQRRDK